MSTLDTLVASVFSWNPVPLQIHILVNSAYLSSNLRCHILYLCLRSQALSPLDLSSFPWIHYAFYPPSPVDNVNSNST